jgi:hypothetical protein
MNMVRKGMLTIAAALLTAGVAAGTAHANPPASSTGCKVSMVSLHATDLWHSSKDWVWIVMDGQYYPNGTKSILFYGGTTQPASVFGDPSAQVSGSGSTTFQLVLDRTWPTANLVIDSYTVSCATTGPNQSTTLSDGTASYKLTYDVTPN